MSIRFSKVDFEKQIIDLNEAKKIASLYPCQRDVSQSTQPTLIGSYLCKEDLNPGVYSQAYVDRISELSRQLLIKICKNKEGSQESFASLEDASNNAKCEREVVLTTPPAQGYHSIERDASAVDITFKDGDYIDMTRLVHLHRKYCSGKNGAENSKSLEDLQKDLHSCSDDFRKLEIFL